MKPTYTTRFAAASAAICCVFFSFSTEAEEASTGGAKLLQDVVVEPKDIQLPAEGASSRIIPNPSGAEFRVKLHIPTPSPGAEWTIAVRDDSHSEIVSADELRRSPEWYSGSLFSGRAQIEVLGPRRGFNGLTVESILRGAQRGNPQSVGSPILNYDHPAVTTEQRELARSVAKVELGSGASCTGFVIGAKYVLTNRHCLRGSAQFSAAGAHSPGPCGDMFVLFDFATADRKSARQAKCAFAYMDLDEDLAVLEIKMVSGDVPPPLPISATAPTPSTAVYSVGHPVGLPLRFTRCCGFFLFAKQIGTHDCPTYTGGSGSPILDNTGHVVAINVLTDYDDPWLTPVDIESALAKGAEFRSKALLLAANKFVQRFIQH